MSMENFVYIYIAKNVIVSCVGVSQSKPRKLKQCIFSYFFLNIYGLLYRLDISSEIHCLKVGKPYIAD